MPLAARKSAQRMRAGRQVVELAIFRAERLVRVVVGFVGLVVQNDVNVLALVAVRVFIDGVAGYGERRRNGIAVYVLAVSRGGEAQRHVPCRTCPVITRSLIYGDRIGWPARRRSAGGGVI